MDRVIRVIEKATIVGIVAVIGILLTLVIYNGVVLGGFNYWT